MMTGEEFTRIENHGLSLAACPVCKAEAELWERSTDGGETVAKAVMCSRSAAFGPLDGCPLYLPPEGLYRATRREAVQAWGALVYAVRGTNDGLPLRVELPHLPVRCVEHDGMVDMAVGREVLRFSAENHPLFYDPDSRPDGPNIVVTNAQVFAAEVANEINSEREDGSSLLTDMLDEAIKRAVENGCEGVDHDA